MLPLLQTYISSYNYLLLAYFSQLLRIIHLYDINTNQNICYFRYLNFMQTTYIFAIQANVLPKIT